MKKVHLVIANIVGIVFLMDFFPLLTFAATVKLSVVAALVAIISYCVFASDKSEENTPFHVFCGALILIVDAWIGYVNREPLSVMLLFFVLFVVNSLIYWVLKGFFISESSKDNQTKL